MGIVEARPRAERAGLTSSLTHVWPALVGGAVLAWSGALFLRARSEYESFRLFGYDLGNMVQAVWSSAHGDLLEVTNGPTGEQMSRLGLHVDPILAGLAPIWILAPSPVTLIAVQIAAVGLGALPVYWLGVRHLGSERAASFLALAYLAYPWTAWAALDTFHPVVLAIPLFLYAIWFLDGDRLLPFAICATLAAATGELMGLAVAALGVWYALARGARLAGLAIAGCGAAWTILAIYVVVPSFSGGDSVFYGAFETVGGSPQGVARMLVTDPLSILSAVTTDDDLVYFLALAVPLGAAFLLAPGLALAALPQLAANSLSGLSSTTYPHLHYVSGIVPFLVAATVLGVARLSAERRVAGASVLLFLSVTAGLTVGPWPGALAGRPSWTTANVSAARAEALRQAVALVPANARVTSTGRVRPRLAERRYVASVPTIAGAGWIVVDERDTWIPSSSGGGISAPETLEVFTSRVSRSAEWRLVFRQHGVSLFRRSTE